MLAYHPALDPYHAAARLLRVLTYPVAKPLEVERVRIIDFYLTFPAWIKSIRLPASEQKLRNKVSPPTNPYYYNGRPPNVFSQMKPLQLQAISLLAARNLIDKTAFSKDIYVRGNESIPEPLRLLSVPTIPVDAERLSFLLGTLAKYSLLGVDGLKHRTGLMEFKYDPT